MTRFTLNRRRLLMAGLAGLGMTAPGLTASFAQTPGPGGRKLVLVILRGAMDGLAALAPTADPLYTDYRGGLALMRGTPLAGGFTLHPALSTLASLWSRGQALGIQAIATPYRDRSHFDGQDLLETGGQRAGLNSDGWLNRVLQVLGGAAPGALGVGGSLPLVLRGAAPASSWSPPVLPEVDPSTVTRLMDLYADDVVLSEALMLAIETDLIAGDIGDDTGGRVTPADLASAAASLMIANDGPDLAVLELEGWDTHVNQGADEGQLANRLSELDAAIDALQAGLGAYWGDTAVMVTTEFGRTVRVNGGGGTDHGTGGAAFLLGGAVRGGDVIGDWPGLNDLYEDRDLRPANDMRSLFKGVLRDHWGVDPSVLDTTVFPDSAGVAPFSNLII
ncbi:MAG: DUF1501 domain-containing protein [Pseudomonadota bacterium]